MSELWADSASSRSPASSGFDFGDSDVGAFTQPSGHDFDLELAFSPSPSNMGADFNSPLGQASAANLLNFHTALPLHTASTGVPVVPSVTCGHQPQCRSKEQHIAVLNAYIKQLESALGSKNAKLADYRWLRERFDKLVAAYEALSKAQAANVPAPAANAVPAPPRLSRKQYPKVLYWKRVDWTTSPESSKAKVATIRGSEGKQVHKILPFLQDAHGNIADWERLSAMRASLRGFWAHLLSKGDAPTNWGEVQFEHMQKIRFGMHNLYEELTLCDDDRKLHWLCTEGYSSWYGNRKDKLVIKQEAAADEAGLVHDNHSGNATNAVVAPTNKRALPTADSRASAPPAKRLQSTRSSQGESHATAPSAPPVHPAPFESPASSLSATLSPPHTTSQTALNPEVLEQGVPRLPTSTAKDLIQNLPATKGQTSAADVQMNEPDQEVQAPPKKQLQNPAIHNPLSKFVSAPVQRNSTLPRVPTRLELVNKMAQQIQSDPSSVAGIASPAATKKKAGQATKTIDRSAKVVKPRANVTAPDLMCKLEWWEAHQDDTEGDWQDYWDSLAAEEVQKWQARSVEKKALNAAKKKGN